MTPEEFAKLLDGPAPSTPATPSTPAPSPAAAPDPTAGLTPQEFAALLDGPAPQAAPPAAPQAPFQGEKDAFGFTAGQRQQMGTAVTEQPGLASRVASDIGTGITELPRAALKGSRDAVQETGSFLADADRWFNENFNAVGDLGPSQSPLPALPEVDAPKSTTGKLAATVSQFITGMVGLGKITKPLEVAGKLATAGRAAKIGTETAKAATVGAVAFDPHGPRLADLVESVPGLSNPITRYLKADPTDSAAEGRIKNAMESIGMDAVLIGGVMMSAKLYRVMRDREAGKATQADVDRVVAEAEAQGKQVREGAQSPASEATGSPRQEAPGPAPEMREAGPEVTPAQPPDATTAPAPTRDILELGSEAGTASAPRRDVMDLSAPKADHAADTVPSAPVEVAPEQTTGLLKAMREDADALAKAEGDWNRATDTGHIFGQGARVPWQKLRVDGPEGDGLEAFMRRLADETEAQHNAMRGGDANGVLSDARVQTMVADSSRLFGSDPALVTGRLAMAGDAAQRMAVELEISYTAAAKALQDSYALAARIKAGDLTEFAGNADAAAEALRLQLADAGTLFGYGQAIRAGAGRTMRRMRQEFGPKPEDIEAMRGLNPQALVEAIVQTGGDPRAIVKLTSRSGLQQLGDWMESVYLNGLLSSPKTHLVNFVTSTWMLGLRPLERMVGSVILDRSLSGPALREAQRQYAYMAMQLGESWRFAKDAWMRGDSVMAPRSLEPFTSNRVNAASLAFKPADSLTNSLHNVLVAAAKAVTVPTRALGAADEMLQSVAYRSKVAARAHMEAIEQGLEGDALTAFVRDKLAGAYDDTLRATDAAALQEARISTFQQDLLPGTTGHGVASFTANHRWSRFILPFVRTPTNVLRYGWKLTPGLNLLQTEYSQMLKGKMGAEAQAQAVGQMTLGALFLGNAALLAHAGIITGGGPSDPQLKAKLMATGWRPYSVVKVHADGSRTYAPFSPFDPIGIPFGIVADIVDAIQGTDEEAGIPWQVSQAMLATGMSVAKQMANKAYLKGLNDFLEAITEPDKGAEKWVGQTASSFVPFSSAIRFANPDPHLRDARSVTDRMLTGIPGLSGSLPPRRDMWGDPITVNKGLWVTSEADLVDAEMRRMVLEAGFAPGAPSPDVGGVDLRDITMVNGRNAYDHYQDLAARPAPKARSIKEAVGRIIQSPAYQRAPDGDAGTRGTKLWMLSGVMAKYRQSAAMRMRTDKNVRDAMLQKRRDVAAAYAAKSAPKTPEQQGKGTISDIGKAFGVDLDGLMQ